VSGSVKRGVCVIAATLLLSGALADAPVSAQETGVVARDAWVRVPAPSKDETALYLALENRGAQRRAVVAVSSDAAASAEMHEMRMSGKMMAMLPIAQIAIPAHGKTELRPGGLHIMLFGLKTRPGIGDSIHVTLTLDDGSRISTTATVRK
jgi:copper(I)-binding protein